MHRLQDSPCDVVIIISICWPLPEVACPWTVALLFSPLPVMQLLSTACVCALTSRSLCRCAKEGRLVEVRNHDWLGPPALGMLGPPAAALQGSLAHQPTQQQGRQVVCSWCKAQDHLIKDCPLNYYLDENMDDTLQQDAELAQSAGMHMVTDIFAAQMKSC